MVPVSSPEKSLEMIVFTFEEYSVDYSDMGGIVGNGWHLNKDGESTEYYIFSEKDSTNYELYYSNGFDITSGHDLEFIQNLVIALFAKFPRMISDNSRWNKEEFNAIKDFVSSYQFNKSED